MKIVPGSVYRVTDLSHPWVKSGLGRLAVPAVDFDGAVFLINTYFAQVPKNLSTQEYLYKLVSDPHVANDALKACLRNSVSFDFNGYNRLWQLKDRMELAENLLRFVEVSFNDYVKYPLSLSLTCVLRLGSGSRLRTSYFVDKSVVNEPYGWIKQELAKLREYDGKFPSQSDVKRTYRHLLEYVKDNDVAEKMKANPSDPCARYAVLLFLRMECLLYAKSACQEAEEAIMSISSRADVMDVLTSTCEYRLNSEGVRCEN